MASNRISPELSVVILAAGIGSRFGGNKQLAPVGPKGEAFLDYTISGCQEAGIDRVVLVVRSDIQAAVASHVAKFHQDAGQFSYVCQDTFGPSRQKPWGTAHAVLAAKDAVPGPFIVANADDYYSPQAFQMLREFWDVGFDDHGGLLGFALENTLPAEGAVTRGLCEVYDGYLTGIVETKGIQHTPSGIVSGSGEKLDPETLVSLNFWGFPRGFMASLENFWEAFYVLNEGDPDKECLLPDAVAAMIAVKDFEFRVRPCDLKWVGVTYQDDLAAAREVFGQGDLS